MAKVGIWKSEAEYQAACFKRFDRDYPSLRGRLIMIYNNPPNAIMGALLKSMGLRKGASDHAFFYSYSKIAFIEYKIDYRKQTPEQEEFQAMVESLGFEYYVLNGDVEDFIDLITLLMKKS